MSKSSDESWLFGLRFLSSLAHAKKGDPMAGKELLRTFVDCVEAGREVPPEVIEYLADAFDSFLQGKKKVDQALNVRRKRGGANRRVLPQFEPSFRDALLAGEVYVLRKAGKSFLDAVGEIADKWEIDDSTVKRAWPKGLKMT